MLHQEQETKQSGFSKLLPPVSLQVRDAEAFKTQHNHTTYLQKQGKKQKGTWCRTKTKYYLSYAAPCISFLLTAPKHLPMAH